MNKAVLGFLSAILLAISPVADTQTTKPLPRVAYVWLFGIGPSAPFAKEFAARLAELGWIDGKTVRIEYRDAKSDPEKLAAIMHELVESKVDVIAVACTPEAMAAKKATATIPVVVAATGDPVRSGLVASLARPEGNITGISSSLLEMSAKRMQILKEVAPNVARATVLWNPARVDNAVEVAVMQEAAKGLGIQLQSQQVRDRDEIEVALDAMVKERSQGITEAGDPFMFGYAPELVAFAARTRTPAVYDNDFFVERGGLMSYGPNLPTLHKRAADYVDKILRGAKPADLPFEQPKQFELVLNLRTAKALGITFPKSLLVRADHTVD